MLSDAQAQALRALSNFLVAKTSMGDTLLNVSRITVEAMPAADMAGISLLGENGRPTTGVFTDDEAPDIDSAQYESGRGPCLDSWREGRVIRVDDVAAAGDVYPEFAEAAQAHGVRSTLSLPLMAGDARLGALNLYARVAGGFTSDDEALGTDLAAAASIVLANASAFWAASELSDQLGQAMRSRAVIEQAKGVLMARSPQMPPDEAFDVLRKASQRENVKVRDIAQRIVDRKPAEASSSELR